MSTTIRDAIGEWDRQLQSEKRSPRTRVLYRYELERLATWSESHSFDISLDTLTEKHLRDFYATLEGLSDTSQSIAFRSIGTFLHWAATDVDTLATKRGRRYGAGMLAKDPQRRLTAPVVDHKEKAVRQLDEMVSDEDLSKVYARIAKDPHRTARYRDAALISFIASTGARLGEVAGLKLADLDMAAQTAVVRGKTGVRTVHFGNQTATRMDRWLRQRRLHFAAKGTDALWLGRKGAMSESGISQVFRQRRDEAELKRFHPHMLRHKMASGWLAKGGGETSLQVQAGWTSNAMVRHYGAYNETERTIADHARLFGDS